MTIVVSLLILLVLSYFAGFVGALIWAILHFVGLL